MNVEDIQEAFNKAIRLDNQKSYSTGKVSNDDTWSCMYEHFEDLLHFAKNVKRSRSERFYKDRNDIDDFLEELESEK